MAEPNLLDPQTVISYPNSDWRATSAATSVAVDALEQGKVLFFPALAFPLNAQQRSLLDPALVDPKRKNISYDASSQQIKGVANLDKQPQIKELLADYYQSCRALIDSVLPEYQNVLRKPVNSLRLHPVSEWTHNSSWRKDDTRLHVDAFPSRPSYGERILRIFTNINPHGEDRVWRIGEPFPQLAERYLPTLAGFSPFKSWLQHKLFITKTPRSHYDHLMLQMHDRMKSDADYQKNGQQITQRFPAGSSWICFSDQTPHAAMGGQFMLEQTFLLSVKDMHNPDASPLRTLQRLTNKTLI